MVGINKASHSLHLDNVLASSSLPSSSYAFRKWESVNIRSMKIFTMGETYLYVSQERECWKVWVDSSKNGRTYEVP